MSDAQGRFDANDLIIADAFADMLDAKFKAAGIGVMTTPMPRKPGIFSVYRAKDRDLCKRLNSVGLHLTDEVRIRFHVARQDGQGYDDATGYWLRLWAAAFALPFKPAWFSRSVLGHEG